MKRLIAIALLIGAMITAFHGFSLSLPALGHKSMSRVNDMLGTMAIEMEVSPYPAGTDNRCVPFYVVAVLAGAAGLYILNELRDDDEEEDFY